MYSVVKCGVWRELSRQLNYRSQIQVRIEGNDGFPFNCLTQLHNFPK
jgi:hypothetical protein